MWYVLDVKTIWSACAYSDSLQGCILSATVISYAVWMELLSASLGTKMNYDEIECNSLNHKITHCAIITTFMSLNICFGLLV